MQTTQRPKVVIIGAGFGGLQTALGLVNQAVDVLLIDRNNYHLFTPLLYQVATCGLDPSDIAYPVRGIVRKQRNLQFRLGEVTAIDPDSRAITIREASGDVHIEPYDYLVIASGSTNNYFGNPDIQKHGFGMKDLDEALTLRNHILRLFEQAAWVDEVETRRALTTLVVVGGGPTGIETAGALYELYNFVVKREYSHIRDMDARVILLEATDRLLAPYPEKLRQAALDQLRSLGVEVLLNAKVQSVDAEQVSLADGRSITTHTLVWAAGVQASPLAAMLNVPLERGGRIPVAPSLEVMGRERIYALGDIAHLINPNDQQPYPQVILVAKQQGKRTAHNILKSIAGQPQTAFAYYDRGIMATIGRQRAVAYPFNRIQLTGWLAWVTWLGLHLLWLMGFRNQASVFINWVWNYLTYDRSVRIIVRPASIPVKQPDVPAKEGA
ncbi:MAG: NAD(P)/FAD-dependent oxidoreductase [Armatimonadetes bacterium]|nr:NAD(P)/FAD-dependent oxidoreductase [Anaerolineae bacterium]